MKVSVFKNLMATDQPPSGVNVDVVLERIRIGDKGLKELITKIRKANDVERSSLKKDLPSIIFSGYCGTGVEVTNRMTKRKYLSYRTDQSLSSHSGLCVIDLDKLSNVRHWKKQLSQLDTVYAAFVSPSGNGLKVVFRIPANIEMHRQYYKAILEDLQKMGLEVDPTSINESRVCFISYDPDIYINKDAVEFTDFIIDEAQDIEEKVISKGDGLTDYKKLSIAATMIDNAVDGRRHETLIKASYLMGGYIQSGYVDEEEARVMLRNRIKAKNVADIGAAFKTIEDGLEAGKKKPLYEIEDIEREFKISELKEKYKSEDRGYAFLVDRAEVSTKVDEIIKHGIPEGLKTGIKSLDNHFRFKENNFTVWLGHDNTGKSFFVWWLAVVASMKYGHKWIIYGPENDIPKITIHLMEFVMGKRIRGAGVTRIKMAKDFVDKHFYFIRKDKVYTAFDLLEFGRVMVDNDTQIKGFIIDPYNSLALDYKGQGAGLNSYEYHMRVISEMRVFSETHCSIHVIAHSVTEARRLKADDNGDIPRPYKAHIDGGAIWANRCDDFYVIHRQVKNELAWNITEIHADKIKDIDTGTEITRGDPVKMTLYMNSDFVDAEDNTSCLTTVRKHLFGEGEQQNMKLGGNILGDPANAF